jgi:hypothetical protein
MQASAENYTGLLWTSSGDGTFDDAAALNPIYTPGIADQLGGMVTLVLTAMHEPCSDVTDDFILYFYFLPNPVISGADSVCQLSEGILYSAPEIQGHSYQWEISGGIIEEGTSTNEIAVIWQQTGTGIVTLSETNDSTGCNSSVTFPVTVNPLPVPSISGQPELCVGTSDVTYSTQYYVGNSYLWSILSGTINSGQGTGEVSVSWDVAGRGFIAVTETNDLTGCEAASDFNIKVNALPLVNLGADTSICHNHVLTLNAGNPDAYSWEWSTGENKQEITIDSTGAGIGGTKVISVTVTDLKGCFTSDTIAIYFEDCSGINENTNDLGVNIFPNPNTGVFILELIPRENCVVRISIVNSAGVTILEENDIAITGILRKEFKMDNFNNGSYYLNVEGMNIHSVNKIIIQK